MSTGQETSAGGGVPAETEKLIEADKPTETDQPTGTEMATQANRSTSGPYKFLGLLTICLITLFTVSIWKTTVDLGAQRKRGCPTIKGDNDMYGLGIRLGVYMQLIVSAFVDSFGNQQYSSGLVSSTLWYLFALSAALSMKLRESETYSTEIYIIISLGDAVTTVMLSKIVKFNPLTSNESYLLSLGRLVLWAVWRVSTSIYWFTLLHDYRYGGSDGPNCARWGWIFFKVDLEGSFQEFNEGINLVQWAILCVLLLGYLIGIIIFCYALSRIKWDKERPVKVSKFFIAFDYLFVSIGELRQIMYGVNDEGYPDPLPPSTDAEGGRSVKLSVHLYEARLKRHIEAQYPEQNPGAGPAQGGIETKKSGAGQGQGGVETEKLGAGLGQGGIETTTGAGRGSVIPTYRLLRVYWQHREGILKKLHATGFKTIKIPLCLLWDISTIAYTILNVEFSLRMNHIDDIYEMWNVGQLIPVIIGAGGIGVAAAELFVYEREKRGVRWRSLGVAKIKRQPPDNKKTEAPQEKAHDKMTGSINGEASHLGRIESSSTLVE